MDARLVLKPNQSCALKRGDSIFGVGKENNQAEGTQVLNPNSHEKEDSFSGSNYSGGGRRRIDPSKLKRKKILTTSHHQDTEIPTKKLHLVLRDEDDILTAEAAAQPRRIQ